jgi:hypothetical protein
MRELRQLWGAATILSFECQQSKAVPSLVAQYVRARMDVEECKLPSTNCKPRGIAVLEDWTTTCTEVDAYVSPAVVKQGKTTPFPRRYLDACYPEVEDEGFSFGEVHGLGVVISISWPCLESGHESTTQFAVSIISNHRLYKSSILTHYDRDTYVAGFSERTETLLPHHRHR